ncbi:MAG TPA: Dabb family protein [Actinomycetales bacterium]|nr:Dabb family protein [Actinomycetales bacterium]
MIRHVVLFFLKDGVTSDDPRVVEGLEASRELGRSLPEALTWTMEPNISDRDIAADFVAIGDFADKQSLTEFLRHPDHQAAGAHWGDLATLRIADFHVR